MDTTILQVPIRKDLRDKAVLTAESMGFSSLQETIRVFLKSFASGELEIGFRPKAVRLSERNDRRYSKMIADYRAGKLKTKSFDSVDELMDYLSK